ncbi:TIP-1 family-domain-containing protein [Phlyctochytrium arcticum]|nr:TIP-1 family-domain-containing protein [Phlyctochytrium arcticum]
MVQQRAMPRASTLEVLHGQLQSWESLADAEAFLSIKKAEHYTLQEKTSKLKNELPEQLQAIMGQAKQVQTQLQNLRQQRAHITEELDSFPRDREVIEVLRAAQTKLKRLDAAKEYVTLLLRVESLSTQVETNIESNMQKALKAYEELWQIWNQNQGKENVAEELIVAPGTIPPIAPLLSADFANFNKYLNTVTSGWHLKLKTNLARKLEQALTALGWPNPIKLVPESTDSKAEAFKDAFVNLLRLRAPLVRRKDEIVFLPPMEVLLQAPVLHFKYHFEGSRPTNRLDKPEWAFTRVLTAIRDHSSFLCGPVQDILRANGHESFDAKNEFIQGMLVAVMHKLRIDAPRLLGEAQLLSHAINETLAFDASLRDIHLYEPPTGTAWKGCVAIFTEQAEWFQEWLAIETAAARERFEETIDADEAWEWLDETVNDSEDLKPTQSAETFVNILETITDHYRLLPDFVHRLAFFNEIQLPLLEDYLQEVRNGIKRHISTFHPINTPGAQRPNKASRLQMLCRYASSLHYVATVLRDWADQPFFVEFWDTLKNQAPDTHDEDSTIFSQVIGAYEQRVARIEDILTQDIMQEFVEAMWQYDRKRNWVSGPARFPPAAGDHASEITPEFCECLEALNHFLPIIFDNLPAPKAQIVLRSLASQIDDHLYKRVIMRSRFNSAGARQVRVDITYGLWNGVFRRWHRKPEALFRKINESLIILTLPIRTEDKTLSLGTLIDYLLENDVKVLRPALEKVGVFRMELEQVQDVVNRTVEVENLANII